MKNYPLVSVIMNCHNGEKYLKESINSILSQTYQNWEIIFWDNLSTDNSKKIVSKINDERIKYFSSQKFLNLYEARNLAINEASGEYFCFLDVDDLYEQNKLELQVKFLEENKEYEMVYSNYFTLEEKNKNRYIKLKFNLPTESITSKILKNYTVGLVTVLIKKKNFESLKFNGNYNIIGDFDFFIKVSRKIKIGCIQKPLSTYRIHDRNYSKIKLQNYITELKNWIRENEKVFKSEGYTLFHQKIYLFKLTIKYFLRRIFFN